MHGVAGRVTEAEVLEILSTVMDPELPTVDVVGLGIVRGVEVDGDTVRVDVTPTYSGCPAMRVIEADITEALRAKGFRDVAIRTLYSPAWNTDWISADTKEKMRLSGIAPPVGGSGENVSVLELVTLERAKPAIECPFCRSTNTRERSEFGSTACKAIYFCESCRQPFDYFKAF